MAKLVRDKIPEIMKAKGQCPATRIVENDDEFLSFLQKKLVEEVKEFIETSQADNPKEAEEELADILEVIDTMCRLRNYDLASVQRLKDKKRSERGGFDEKILLL